MHLVSKPRRVGTVAGEDTTAIELGVDQLLSLALASGLLEQDMTGGGELVDLALTGFLRRWSRPARAGRRPGRSEWFQRDPGRRHCRGTWPRAARRSRSRSRPWMRITACGCFGSDAMARAAFTWGAEPSPWACRVARACDSSMMGAVTELVPCHRRALPRKIASPVTRFKVAACAITWAGP